MAEESEFDPLLKPLLVTVEMDAFSGRANPHWEVQGAAADDLHHRLLGLKLAVKRGLADLPPGLGYRGLRVALIGEHNIVRFEIGGGQVVGPREVFEDREGALEQAVLATMPLKLRATFGNSLPDS